MSHPGGRPPIYSEALLLKAKEYSLTLPLDEVIHTVAGLAVHLGIARDTVYEWAKEENEKGELVKQEFSDIVVQILAQQEKNLINKGLKGEFNSSIAKLLLAKHGYKDESDVTSGGEKMNGVIMLPSKNENPLETPTKAGDSPS